MMLTVLTIRTAPSRMAKTSKFKPAAGRQVDQTLICHSCQIENCGIYV